MAAVLVLYHSMYGHIETMANKIAEGARGVPGAEVVIKRAPETIRPEAFAAAGGMKTSPCLANCFRLWLQI